MKIWHLPERLLMANSLCLPVMPLLISVPKTARLRQMSDTPALLMILTPDHSPGSWKEPSLLMANKALQMEKAQAPRVLKLSDTAVMRHQFF
jgi:hypothetical protein